jgi:hypothetical protein
MQQKIHQTGGAMQAVDAIMRYTWSTRRAREE